MKRYIILIIAYCIGIFDLHAQYTVSSVPNPRDIDATAFVANPNAILSNEDANQLQEIAARLHTATEAELVTVVLGNIGEADAFDFSLELFNTWGIGDKEKNTGILIFFALESRDIRIVTGGGVEGLLTDAVCSEIVNGIMIPLLREGNYGEGLIAGAKGIEQVLSTDAAKAELLLGYHPKPVTETPWSIFSVISLIIAAIAAWKKYREKHPAKYHPSDFGNDSPSQHSHGGFYGGVHGGGFGGGFHGGSFGGGVSFGGGAGGKF